MRVQSVPNPDLGARPATHQRVTPVEATSPTERLDTSTSDPHAEKQATEQREQQRPAPPMPNLSPADRAAVAAATGYYLSPTGEVVPEGNPPWPFIVQYVEERHQARLDVTA